MTEQLKGRPPCEGRVYLRRSSERQESGVYAQLEWARQKALEHGITLDASKADLKHMLDTSMSRSKDIYLDDAITGAELVRRPGLAQLLQDIRTDARISHIFVHMVDRLARPEHAEDGLRIETEIRSRGVTLVFLNRVLRPQRRGEKDIGEKILSLVDYHKSGEFLNDLATRVIECQKSLAEQGYWTGGRPPYGCKRVRVSADGTEVSMPAGRAIKEPGSHTELRLDDPEKIRVVLMIFHLFHDLSWGVKRIAIELNKQKVPSPDAGRTRSEHGYSHQVSGLWTAGTVRSILSNSVYIGVLEYGHRSEGHHRRLGRFGPRYLDESDFDSKERPRLIKNPADVVVFAPLKGLEPPVTKECFERCQEILNVRSQNQRGIPRSSDPAKYPLSSRVFDLNCSHPMYGRTSKSRRLYTCSQYINTDGNSCDHNQVDAAAALEFVLRTLRQKVHMSGRRDALRGHLEKIAREAAPRNLKAEEGQLKSLQARLTAAERDLELIKSNLAYAKNKEEYDSTSSIFDGKFTEIADLRREIEPLEHKLDSSARTRSMDDEIECALAVFDRIEMLSDDTRARSEIRPFLKQINFNLWLRFGEGRKGRRPVRVLESGIITTGSAALPIQPYSGKTHPSRVSPRRRVVVEGGPQRAPRASHLPPGGRFIQKG